MWVCKRPKKQKVPHVEHKLYRENHACRERSNFMLLDFPKVFDIIKHDKIVKISEAINNYGKRSQMKNY